MSIKNVIFSGDCVVLNGLNQEQIKAVKKFVENDFKFNEQYTVTSVKDFFDYFLVQPDLFKYSKDPFENTKDFYDALQSAVLEAIRQKTLIDSTDDCVYDFDIFAEYVLQIMIICHTYLKFIGYNSEELERVFFERIVCEGRRDKNENI